MKPMKEKEKLVYEYVAGVIRDNGYSPSVRDIRDALGFRSTSTVQMYLERLAERGLIEKASGKSRTLRLGTTEQSVPVRVPILGDVAAGRLTLAEESYDGYADICVRHGVDRENLFALRVRGESMKNAGILDGELGDGDFGVLHAIELSR